MTEFENDFAGKITVSAQKYPYRLYEHQIEALNALNKCTGKKKYRGLLVLPTGGGKTVTAVIWILKSFINQGKKVLWIAHRHELLNQACYTIKNCAYSDILPDKKEFGYRIISGLHDKPVNIKPSDDILIASKDSLNHGQEYLRNWISQNRDNIVLIIDEAHHATARSYRTIINLLESENENWFQMLGLTATPLRTEENEKGILGSIFSDGIVYGIDLKTLISRKILADPIFVELNTKIDLSNELSDKDIQNIQAFDSLPEEMAERIARNKERNNLIVEHYAENQDKYGQMLLFALDVDHAIALSSLFKSRGIPADYVVSNIKDMYTKVSVSNKDNAEKIQKFRDGNIRVLINVNILTEGTDLPKVESVFLTRPTISTILMTQMIGRALRGEAAGGTEKAYIVSFIDGWNDKIAWVNPQRLIAIETGNIKERETAHRENVTRLIAISKIEEFSKILDQTVDTTELEKINFIERVPVGLYSFSILIHVDGEEDYTKNCAIIVYNCFRQSFEDFVNDLDVIFKEKSLDGKEYLDEFELRYLCDFVKKEYFDGYKYPIAYRDEDIKDILRYYALKETKPVLLDFKDRGSFNLSDIARDIWDKDMGIKKQAEYLDSLWNDDKKFYRIFFGNNIKYFLQLVDIELHKLSNPGLYSERKDIPTVIPESVELKNLPLNLIKEKDIYYWRKLVNQVYEKAKDEDGFYHCAISDYKSKSKACFQIDHIVPMSRGGLSTPDNLQLLARWVNLEKGDSVDFEVGAKEKKEEAGGNPPEPVDSSDISRNGSESELTQLHGKLKQMDCDTAISIMDNIDPVSNYDELMELCAEGIQLFPDQNDFYYERARIANSAQKYEQALEWIDQAINAGHNIPKNYILNGDIYFNRKEYSNSINCYENALKTEPNNSDALDGIGCALNAQSKNEEAIQYFDRIIKQDPSFDLAYFNKGISLRNMGDFAEAVENFDRFVVLQPDDIEGYTEKASTLIDMGRSEDAFPLIEKAETIVPDNSRVYFLKGAAQSCKGDFDSAIENYNHAIRLDPEDSLSYFWKGSDLYEKKLFQQSLECLNEAIRLDNQKGKYYYSRGLTYQSLKQKNEALSDFIKAAELDPSLEDAFFQAAYIYGSKRQYEQARTYYASVIKLNPQNIDAFNNTGWEYEKEKNYKEALAYYDKALQIDPGYKLTLRNKKRLIENLEAQETEKAKSAPRSFLSKLFSNNH